MSNWNKKTDQNSHTVFSLHFAKLAPPISLVPVVNFTVTTRVSRSHYEVCCVHSLFSLFGPCIEEFMKCEVHNQTILVIKRLGNQYCSARAG